MSLWQRSQASDCMKYFAGIVPPFLVCAELGKKRPCGPSPSPSIVAGAIAGFLILYAFSQVISRTHHALPEIPVVAASTIPTRTTPHMLRYTNHRHRYSENPAWSTTTTH